MKYALIILFLGLCITGCRTNDSLPQVGTGPSIQEIEESDTFIPWWLDTDE